MDSLLSNATASIKLGIEDYGSEDPNRVLSSIRNYYAGLLLLAKAVIMNKAPSESLEQIISSKYKPVLSSDSNLEFVPDGKNTIDFVTIGTRFKDFGISIKTDKLNDLNRLRNDIEHKFTEKSIELLKESISSTFLTMTELFEELDSDPKDELGVECCEIIIEVKDVFEKELEDCRNSFSNVTWGRYSYDPKHFFCPKCHSSLIYQNNGNAKVGFQSMVLNCRICEEETEPEDFIKAILEKRYEIDEFLQAKDGLEPIIYECSDCGLETYIQDALFSGCAWCEYSLGSCGVCEEGLSPNNVCWDNDQLCDRCGYRAFKDD